MNLPLPYSFCKLNKVTLTQSKNTSTLHVCGSLNAHVLSNIEHLFLSEIVKVDHTEDEFESLLTELYTNKSEDFSLDQVEELDLLDIANSISPSDDLLDDKNKGPIIKLINATITKAINARASDIHLEPFESEFKIRMKADGVLQEMVPPPKHLSFAITTRIKVMANLDIAERRMPQDGRIELSVSGHPVDLRVSVLPTLFGESVVMRVLDRGVVSLDLDKLGMDDDILRPFREIIKRPNGIILVTGPTGSGKTTTLYSALSELNEPDDKIITTEDPIEYDIEGIVQVPIDSDIGVTFASALRAILRQDPDRILVGEIRDVETAEIAIQAALTGHMVFSTLHTNDSPATVTRLRDMGVQPFLITATVEAILAQRLVRRICKDCKEEYIPDAESLADLELTSDQIVGKTFYRGSGCDKCSGSGYKGRLGLYELLIMTDELRDLVVRNASTEEIRDLARKAGMVTLRDSGMVNMFEGHTTADEVIRETILEA